jgi:hypothetical protein
LGSIQPTFEPLRDPPDIAGRIAYAAPTVAVGLIVDLPEQFAPGYERAYHRSVRIFDV